MGNVESSEVVQLYLCDLYGSVSRPNKQLKGFEKVLLKPGETKTVSFKLNKDHLSFIGRDNKRIVEPGEFEVMIDALKDKFILMEAAAVK
jgi:beta-glucosidase